MPTLNQNKPPNYITHIICFALGLLVMMYFKSCFNAPVGTHGSAITKHSETFKSDSVRPRDTLIVHHKTKWNVKDSIRYVNKDTTNYCNYTRNYSDTISNNEVDIYTNDSVQGRLLGTSISYKLKVPLVINNTHTITDSVFVPKPYTPRWHKLNNSRVAIGGGIIGFIFGIAAIVSLSK